MVLCTLIDPIYPNINTLPKFIIGGILFMLSLSHSSAQDTTLVDFKSFPYPIISMTHDGYGKIWFNTRFDLYTFDGNDIRWEKHLDDRLTLIYTDGELRSYEFEYSINNPRPWAYNSSWQKYLPSSTKYIFTAPDKTGIIWVTSGANLFGYKVTPYFKRSLVGHSIRGILEHDKQLIINSYSGIFVADSLVLPNMIYSNGNALGFIPGEVWIACNSIIKYNYSTGSIKSMPSSPGPKNHPAIIDHLHKTSNGEVWAGSVSDGLFIVKGDSLVHTNFTKSIEYLNSQGNTLYIATTEGIYTHQANRFEHITKFPSIAFNSIQKLGNNWWATSVQGVWYWNEKMDAAVQLFPSLPLSKLETYGILQDKNGYFWISSIAGLHRFKPELDTYESFLTATEFNKRSFTSARDSFYFGGINGLVAFNPLDLPAFTPKQHTMDRQRKSWAYILTLVVLLAAFIFMFLKWRSTKQRLEETLLNQPSEKSSILLGNIERYIQDNLSTVTVESLSTFTGISKRSLYRILDENYQLKPGDLIRNIRQARIKEILVEFPDMPQEEIARQVGYSLTYINRFIEKERS